VEVEPEAFIEAMNEDAAFNAEMWFEIGEKLHMGLLLDNSMDALRNADVHDLKVIAGALEIFSSLLRSEISDRIEEAKDE
jgi:hypothetical protein